MLLAAPAVVQAATVQLPGSADPGRVQPLKQSEIPDRPPSRISIPPAQLNMDAPTGAAQVRFHLKRIKLQGVTAFSEAELARIYGAYLNREITLDIIWKIAGQITERYQNAGYFLSRAYVPAQSIEGGEVTIIVVEGSITEVRLEDDSLTSQALIQKLIARVKGNVPISAYVLESFMLQMNALPGKEFRAVVEPIQGATSGGVRLSLYPQKEAGKGSVSVDNNGSRYLGPYQATAAYKDSYLPLQQTSLSVSNTSQMDELKYAAIQHAIPFYPDWTIDFSGSYVAAQPGASLKQNEIQSNSVDLSVGVSWQPIRQRQENLIASMEMSGKNSNGDILQNNPLVRDRIRALRTKVSYDVADGWSGYNYLSVEVNRGLGVLGASEAGAANLSRAEAEPEFTSAQLSYTRQQAIYGGVMAVGQVSGQVASDPLFSSEEFGYGGQQFGRAYDPSEITGDQGIASSLELRHLGINPWEGIHVSPYAFYDIGKVWNMDTGGTSASGSSTGLGVRMNHPSGLDGDVGLAWPLTREIGTPLYGNGKNPRVMMQLTYGF